MEEEIRDEVNPDIYRVTNDTSKIQNFLGIIWAVVKNVEHCHDSVEGSNWHRNEEEDKEQGKQSIDEGWFIRVNWVPTSSRSSPLVDEQHVPGRTHDSTIS